MSLTFRRVIGLGLLAQILVTISLLRHESVGGQILGLYSPRYALALAFDAVIVIGLCAALGLHERLERWLATWPGRSRLLAIVAAGTAASAIALLPVELPVKQMVAITFLIGVSLVTYHARQQADPRWNRWTRWALAAVTVLILGMALITALTEFPFSPDEAHWADYASTGARYGGVYARTWMMAPQPIVPGLGWSIAAYGWVLEHVAFDIRAGRLWTYGAYCLMLAGLWLLTRRLYGAAAGWISVALAVFSGVFFPAFDYRPHYQLGAATVFVAWLALGAQSAATPCQRWGAAFAAGLLALLSLQLHAAGLALAAGCSLFMLIRLLQTPRRTGAFAAYLVGAGLGTLIYLVFNIAPVGGVSAFLAGLVADRAQRQSFLYFLTWPTLLEGMIVYAGLAFVLLRRSSADRLLLSLALPVFISMAVIDTQGYRTLTAPLFLVMAAALLAPAASVVTWRRWASAAAALAMMAALTASGQNWPGLLAILRGNELPNYVYADLAAPLSEQISPDDVVAGTHLLIWALPDHERLYSTAGELGVMRRTGVDDPQAVWEAAQPTVVIDIPGQMVLSEGLRRYMDAHSFGLCASLSVGELSVSIYRADC